MADIPSIDLNFDPFSEAEKKQAVLMIQEACTITGFFSIVNHGVQEELLDHCWQASLDFFAQPESEKIKTGMPFAGIPLRLCPDGKRNPVPVPRGFLVDIGLSKIHEKTLNKTVRGNNKDKTINIEQSLSIDRGDDFKSQLITPLDEPPEYSVVLFSKCCIVVHPHAYPLIAKD